MSGIAGIVLAAGEGKRAGGVKALLKLGGRTFLDRVVTAIREAGCDPVIVVGGAEAGRVESESSRLGASFVLNERWQDGQFSSLRAGAGKALGLGDAEAGARASTHHGGDAVSGDEPFRGVAAVSGGTRGAPRAVLTGALVALVDHPAVRRETCRTLLEAFRREPSRIVIPVCEDKQAGRTARGHPVIVPVSMLAEIIDSPADTTLRDLIRKNANLVLEVWVQDPGVLKDVDTAADLGTLNES